MLKKLTVSNLAIVEKAEVDFSPGLNVITGETGSGKSVLMGALELVLGGRADAGVVRDGAKEADVEAEFDDVVIRRTVSATGRTHAWVNDESVSVAELKDLGAGLVDIHGPRANQALLDESFQRESLDAFEAVAPVRARYAAAYAVLSGIRSRIAELKESATGDIEGEIDMLRYQVDELEAAELSPDDEDVAERHAAAAHAGEIVDAANVITEGLSGDGGAAETLIRLQPRLCAIKKHMPEAEEWSNQVDELTMRLQELSRAVADVASNLDVGAESLAALDARLTTINRLERKYKVPLVGDLMALLERKRTRLAELEGRDGKIAELERELVGALDEVKRLGSELSRQRKSVAAKMSKLVTGELRDLGFLQAKFHVAVEPCEPEASGCDRVAYMFEPNPGEPTRPLSAIASSGEIARVMLALKVVVPSTAAAEGRGKRERRLTTLVFDEIDANIGGEVGRIVGAKMRQAAKAHQVIAITHLPQCAAFGERHLVVSKKVSGGRTRMCVATISGEERVREIARMLGGKGSSDVARRHAEELIGIGEEVQ